MLLIFAANEFLVFFKAAVVTAKVRVWVARGKFSLFLSRSIKKKTFISLAKIRSKSHNPLSCIVAVGLPAGRIQATTAVTTSLLWVLQHSRAPFICWMCADWIRSTPEKSPENTKYNKYSNLIMLAGWSSVIDQTSIVMLPPLVLLHYSRLDQRNKQFYLAHERQFPQDF